jgi:purine-binding chemotaxis protein CheW
MSTPAVAPPVQLAGKYLTIILAGESYAIAVLNVREIIRVQPVTPVPQLPPYFKGVINLRGRVVPVMDLREKFGLAAEHTPRTCIIVVQVKAGDGPRTPLGVIVDAVEEVVVLTAADIEPTPEFGTAIDTTCLPGLAKVRGRVRILFDLDRAAGLDKA